MSLADASAQRYRIWIVKTQDWQASNWQDVPPLAIAISPADDAVFSAAEAEAFLDGFNSRMFELRRRLWAVAVPVEVRFEGDARAGQAIAGHRFTGHDSRTVAAAAVRPASGL